LKVVREGYNPYFGIPDIMDLEEKYGFKSTSSSDASIIMGLL